MNKSELVAEIVDRADIGKTKAEAALNAAIEAITRELKTGGTVAIAGFGSFQVKERAARAGRNPRTGESIQIAGARVPAFKAGKMLKDAVS